MRRAAPLAAERVHASGAIAGNRQIGRNFGEPCRTQGGTFCGVRRMEHADVSAALRILPVLWELGNGHMRFLKQRTHRLLLRAVAAHGAWVVQGIRYAAIVKKIACRNKAVQRFPHRDDDCAA